MNENFLQENPLTLFEDFVQIPDEAFDNATDLNEIIALIDTIMEGDDYSRVLSNLYEYDEEAFKKGYSMISDFAKKAEKNEYGNGVKKKYVISFMTKTLSMMDEIIKYGSSFKHKSMAICKIDSRAILPKYKDGGDAGADIYTLEDVKIGSGETKLLRTGLKVAVPGGFKLEIVPRSGLSLTTSLRIPNTPGTIDAGFRNELQIIVHNTGNEEIHLTQHSRVAQMILVPIYKIDWKEISEEEFSKLNTDRGAGFGSSGIVG